MLPIFFFVCFLIIYAFLLLRSFFAWSIGSRLLWKVGYIPPITKTNEIELEVKLYPIEENETIEKVHQDVKINLGVHTHEVPWDSDDAPFSLAAKRALKKYSKDFFIFIQNVIIFIINFTLWCCKETSSVKDLVTIFNKSLNAYLAFISFSYIYIMTTTSTIFVCNKVNFSK
jgi:hypothetical protein